MATGAIALWMYRNEGGDKIQNALKLKLESRGHKVINDFDMRDCYYLNGNIYTKCQQNLSEIDLLYHMNADEQSAHQNEILRALDLSSVTVINSWNAFANAKDKFVTNLLLRKNGINVPPAALIPIHMISSVIEQLFYEWKAVVFKPRANHGGKGIIKFNEASDLIDFSQALGPYVSNYYLEKYIDFSEHDYRVEVFKGEVVGGYCRTKTHSFKTNVACGGLMTPISPPLECNKLALNAAEILGTDTTIIDMVRSNEDDQLYILEMGEIMGIFVEAGMRSGEKSTVTEIHPVFANDDLKLDMLAEYLDNIIKSKYLNY
ncbi:MAG TPA: alpha-L-glutamate ligase [Legionella sp.]|nr:alpha-L-glutamate ligase [Legionella sp.]